MLHLFPFSNAHHYPVYAKGAATTVKAQRCSPEACRLPGGRLPGVVSLGCLAFRDSRGCAPTKRSSEACPGVW